MSETKIVQVPVGHMANYAYLIGDLVTKTCAVVDPSWDPDRIIAAAAEAGWEITTILLTHTHYDHANALEPLVERTGGKTYVHVAEKSAIPIGVDAVTTEDGAEIHVGRTLVTCMHTPGHTPGSQCFLTADHVITGDTLFVGACGRTDLPGGSAELLIRSLQRLAALPAETTVYPGHDYGDRPTSTIGVQKKTNSFMDPQLAMRMLGS